MEKPAALSALVAHRRAVVATVVGAGVLFSLAGFWFARNTEERRIEAAFQRRSSVQVRLARERLKLHEEVVHGLRAYLEHSAEVREAEFAAYTRPLLERLPAARVFEWAPRLPHAQRAAFEAGHSAAHPGFRLWERDVAGKIGTAAVPARERPEYWPIAYVEPLAGNEPSLGFDLFSSIVTRPILDIARQSGRMQISPQVRLIRTQEQDRGAGVIFIAPVFRREAPNADADGFIGFIQAIFSVDSLLKQVHAETADEALDLAYFDDSAQFEHLKLLYARIDGREYSGSRDAAPSAIEAPVFPAPGVETVSEIFRIGGREWRLVVAPNAGWIARQRTSLPWLVIGVELAFTALAALFTHAILSRAARIEREVRLRTAELDESRRQLASLLSDMPGAAYRSSAAPPFITTFISDGVHDLTGHAAGEFAAQDLHWHDLILAEDLPGCRQRLSAALARDEPFEFEYRIRHRDGSVRWVWDRGHLVRTPDGRPAFFEGLVVDATARKEAESRNRAFDRQLLETQKLESLGVLAGGIAHDFNNILTAVLGNATLARQSLPPAAPAAAQLQQIEKAARRAADLCTQMLAYAGKGQISTGRIDLSELVRDTTTLLEVSIGKSTRLQLHLHSALPHVHADATQLRQIVMNLVINAADAIGDRSGGEVALHTFTVEASREELHTAVQHPDLPAGLYVGLEVRDNGTGMSPEMLHRIFEPFFTTKFSGRGLGLSAVLGIVRSHRGALFVESTPGVGTTFRLLLPVAPQTPAPPAPAAPSPAPAGAPEVPALRGTVLVVDDEAHVREVTTMALKMAGLEAWEAQDGETALRLCREHPEMIDLILLDLTMPGLSGEETLRRLRIQGAKQKVILISGYSATDTARRCAQLGAVAFLQKPFEIATLFAELRRHLPARQ